MSCFDRFPEPGAETHEYPADSVRQTPSPGFLRDIARLLKTEPDDTQAKPNDDGAEGAQGSHRRPEEEL